MKTENQEEGYMTVEASLVLPMILIVTLLVLLLTFYLYAVCFLNQAAYTAALRGSLVMDGTIEETANEELERLLQNRILNIQDIKSEVSVSALTVEVKLEADMLLPVTGILSLTDPVWEIEVKKEAKIRNASGYIRMLRNMGREGFAETGL